MLLYLYEESKMRTISVKGGWTIDRYIRVFGWKWYGVFLLHASSPHVDPTHATETEISRLGWVNSNARLWGITPCD